MKKFAKNFAIIVSAGQGRRMGTKQKKQYLCLDKIPVLSRTLSVFDQCDVVHEIILVIPPEDHVYCKEHITGSLNLSKKIHMVGGGSQRHESVQNGVNKIQSLVKAQDQTMVFIHDGVRPFVDQALIKKCLYQAIDFGACIPGVQLSDTIKKVDANGCVTSTLDREALYAVQTPQVFKLELLKKAFEHAGKTGFSGTDDASFVEHMGHPVCIVNGSKLNIKITTPDDLMIASQILMHHPNIGGIHSNCGNV